MPASKAQRAATAERRNKAVQLRLAGMDWQTIADRLGYANRGAACLDVTRALETRIAEQRTSVEVYRETELMRLDQLTAEVVGIIKKPHYVVSQSGRIVEDPQTGAPMVDDGPILHAVDRYLKIQDRRAKLLGLDAPQRVEVLTLDAIDAQIRDLTQQLTATRSETEAAPGTP